MPQAFTISSEMRTALAVGESGAFSGRRAAGGASGVGAGASAALGGGAPPHARSAEAPTATRAAVNAGRTVIGALIRFLHKAQGATARDGLIFLHPYRQAWQRLRSYARV